MKLQFRISRAERRCAGSVIEILQKAIPQKAQLFNFFFFVYAEKKIMFKPIYSDNYGCNKTTSF